MSVQIRITRPGITVDSHTHEAGETATADESRAFALVSEGVAEYLSDTDRRAFAAVCRVRSLPAPDAMVYMRGVLASPGS